MILIGPMNMRNIKFTMYTDLNLFAILFVKQNKIHLVIALKSSSIPIL